MLGELSEFWRRLVVNSIRIVLKVAKSNYLLIRNIYRGIARTNNSGRRSGSEHSFSEAPQKYIIHIFCGLCLIKLESKTTMTGSETWKSSSAMVREADEKRKKKWQRPYQAIQTSFTQYKHPSHDKSFLFIFHIRKILYQAITIS